MPFAVHLLERAAAKAGSRYALAKLTRINEGDLSRAARGQRAVPCSWLLPLCRVAGVSPEHALEEWAKERAQRRGKPG